MIKTLTTLIACGLITGLQAQEPITVSTAASNSEQVWYSLSNGEVGRAPLAEWDLAFEVTGLTAGVRVNTAKGITVYETPATFDDWDDLTTPDEENWTVINNEVDRWDLGALNHGNDMDHPDGVNVGWGVYNIATHVMVGNRVYALQMPDESWKKLRINSVAGGIFSFSYANLDGSNAQDAEVNKTGFSGKNFAYWSMETNESLDREPASASWDLLFTKYTDFVPTAYNVAGVLQNRLVSALQVDDMPTDQADWWGEAFSSEIDVLGADWKTYDFDAGGYVITEDQTFFVKDRSGNIWKIVFTGYSGAAAGEMSFNKEMASVAGVDEVAAQQGTLLVYPNPVVNGRAQLVLDIPAREALLHVYNMAGQQMLEQPISGLNGLTTATFDVSGLPQGMYLLRIESNKGAVTGKLVIE